MAKFQVKLSGNWSDYSAEEDKAIKRAFMTGSKDVRFSYRGQRYKYDFTHMTQTNVDTDKCRDIRPPHRWKAPTRLLVPKGKTMCLTIRPGQPGRCIMVNHPEAPHMQFAVNVPKDAKIGRKMLVPVPPVSKAVPAKGKGKAKHGSGASGGRGSGGGDAKPEPPAAEKASSGWGIGTKVAAGTAAVGVGAAAGAVGVYAAEHGWEATGEMLGDGASDAVEAVGDWSEEAVEAVADWGEGALEDAGDWLEGAGEDVGDFFMDLF